MTITTVAPIIGPNGVTAPSYADILSFIRGRYQQIFGADVYVDPDSQDGQFQAVLAEAFYDMGSACVAAYRSFSPSTAVGDALSSNVKINGIVRNVSTFSTVDVQIGGTVGTTIINGSVQDANGNTWNLPATVTIPGAGTITVTATAQAAGDIEANPYTVTTIATPKRGWQTVTNASSAAPGAPVQSDADLRAVQAISTALPSLTVLDGLIGAVANVPGVTRYRPYENDTSSTDSRGISANSIAVVVEGGDSQTIAATIAAKKTPGTGTFGTTSETITNVYGNSQTIHFSRPSEVVVSSVISIKALAGYSSTTGAAAVQALIAYINSVSIGGGDAGSMGWDNCMEAVKSVPGAMTFRVTSLTLSRDSETPAQADVDIAYNEALTTDESHITLAVS
ncbi:putative bacteriophage protein [Rhodanobacter fulvus Jip2]|uniref:Putative bacteriophage protein n=1 Tax=Rhodanobacter fulvus Jip2 TaxID=1163408 RepID=I4VMS8_9GAMM|nr:hypothetical protein [Rhodanobacter fulvus]EIL88519.1 putative bacteriophage protein [Rhodanobacter fulvus Jip2]